MENDFVYLESDMGKDLVIDTSPNKLIDKINDLGKDIEAFEAKLKNVQLELDKTKKELEELKIQQVEELIKENNIEHLYTIQCHPSDFIQNCNIKTHYVGLFLSEKDATACIPVELYSVDERDITWCYKVVTCNIPKNWDGSPKRPPYNFPYGRYIDPNKESNEEYNSKYEYSSDFNRTTI